MAKQEVANDYGVKLSDIKVGDTVRYRVGRDTTYNRSSEVTATVLAVGVKRAQLRSSSYSGAKYGIGDGSGNWLVIDAASTDRDYTNRVWEEYRDEDNYRKYRTVGEQWFLNISKVTVVGNDEIKAKEAEEIDRALRGEAQQQALRDHEAARESVMGDILSIISEATGEETARWGTVDAKSNKVTLSFAQFSALMSGSSITAIETNLTDAMALHIQQARADRAGNRVKVRVNLGGNWRNSEMVKARWSEDGTELERV